jgi:hypothetical protein
MHYSKRMKSRGGGKKGNIFRNFSVSVQRNDLQKWKDRVIYGKRWFVETVFSCLKRRFESMFILSD